MQHLKLNRIGLAALGILLATTLHVQPSSHIPRAEITLGAEAQARSSGGRGGGGSFGTSPSRTSPAGGGYSRPSGGGYSVPSQSYPRDPYGGYRGPVVYPGPVYSPGYFVLGGNAFLFLLMGVGILFLFSTLNSMQSRRGGGATAGYDNSLGELDNETVTITKVQVALLTHSSTIQEELSQITSQADTSTGEGLSAMLQDSVLSLLRKPENWSHALVESQTVNGRQNAQMVFNQLSMAERAKLSAETLVNVGGRVSRKELKPNPDEGPGTYVVVTLLVGTAHDRPLFQSVHSTEELRAVLSKLGGMSPEYLMVLELIWSPQDASDTMTQDEFTEEYTNLLKL